MVFTLASASGNVFAFVWRGAAVDENAFDGAGLAKRVCPRGHGLGLDGLFLLNAPTKEMPWTIEHWDADGSRSFCSNGTRAAAALLPESFQGLVEVCSTDEHALLDRNGLEVGLRLPQGADFLLSDAPENMPFPAVYGWTGTPQLVLQVPDAESIDFPAFAPPLRFHQELPHGANVSVLQVLSPGLAKIRTWERGVEGETQSCGQGAAAAAAWLAEQTGISAWGIQPMGADPLRVDVGKIENRHWSDLWLKGPVRVLGNVTPGPSLQF